MQYKHKLCSGVTLVELIISMAISLIIVLAAGVLLVSGNRSWTNTYNSAHEQIKIDAQTVMLTFGSMGRKANRANYVVYDKNGESLYPALPQTSNPEEVISGDAVEFRYWDVDLDTDDTYGLLDTTKTATAYALFYLDGDKLKVDYGSYPPGAAPPNGGSRNTSNITTTVLAENVTIDPNVGGAFSHTAINGTGRGCVRIKVILTDPNDQDTIDVMTSVMMRNIWPK
jgi:prepilin-type N-terminal cleavage/methylation domain-containing protein